jgi:filamentous hemagglutinin family protein
MYIAVGLLLSGGGSVVGALPVGGTTTTGTGKISQSAGVLTVEQSSARLAIDWQSFSIGSSESVIFKQPSAQSIALNRVLGQDPSVILGSLSANGQVFVLNPNGVLFGHDAQVDVGGLLASSLQLSVADFLAGHYTLSGSDSSGSVINQGALHAHDGGYIALAGPQVINEGVITAHLGTAALGAGQQVTLTMDAGRLLSFNVDRAAADALVSNKQLIEADGGAVIMSALAKDALLSTVVNNQGLIEARSVSVKNGVIQLDGGTNGVVASSGTLDASGMSAGEHGGHVEITGSKVGLFDGALVNASGAAGGGTILIGGDAQGRNPEIHNSQAAYVAPTATIKADALDSGNGGKVVVWSDEMTRFAGSISARGGINGGNGGNIETSGKIYLAAAGTGEGVHRWTKTRLQCAPPREAADHQR